VCLQSVSTLASVYFGNRIVFYTSHPITRKKRVPRRSDDDVPFVPPLSSTDLYIYIYISLQPYNIVVSRIIRLVYINYYDVYTIIYRVVSAYEAFGSLDLDYIRKINPVWPGTPRTVIIKILRNAFKRTICFVAPD